MSERRPEEEVIATLKVASPPPRPPAGGVDSVSATVSGANSESDVVPVRTLAVSAVPADAEPGVTIGRRSGRGASVTSPEAATVRGTQASIAWRAGSGSGRGGPGGGEGPGTGTAAAAAGTGASGGRPSVRLAPDGSPGRRDEGAAPTFEVLRTLGQGGMGVVYAAAQESLRREVALKMIRPDVEAGNETERRFVDEALTTARLDHPNVVSVYDLGRDPSGSLFIAMKLVRGVSWQSLVAPRHGDSEETKARAKALSLRDHLEIFLKVCDALAFAHARDVIHRDLKPDNVMVGAFGEVLVMDWGLALDVSAAARAARGPGANEPPCGTPCFMAPELVKGDLTAQGAATDVYLLGGIVYRLITGTAPHPGSTVAAAIAAALKGDVEPAAERARKHGRTVPAALAEVAAKALAADPARRYASVADLAAAVRGYMHNEGALQLSQTALEELDAIEKRMAVAETARRARLGARAAGPTGESGEVVAADDPHGAAGTYPALAVVAAELGQSIKLWEGNREAVRGLARSRLVTARYALTRGDLGVAHSLLSLVADGSEGKAELVDRLAAELAHRERVRRRRSLLLVMLAVLVVAAGLFAVRETRRAAEAEAAKAQRAEAVKLIEGVFWESTAQRIDAYERAIRIDPTWAEGRMEAAWAMMGLAYETAITAPDGGRRLLDFALGHFDEAIRLVPGDASKISERGYLHEVRGEPEEALRDYRSAAELDPHSALGHSSRGAALTHEGSIEAAERAFTSSLALRRYTNVYLQRGLARVALGDLDGADADGAEYRKPNQDDDEWGTSFAALVLLARGRDREATAPLLAGLRAFPRAPHGLPLLAAYAARRGDLERAKALYARARESQAIYRKVYGRLDILWHTVAWSKDPAIARLGRALMCEQDLAELAPAVRPPALGLRRRGQERLERGDTEGALADATLVVADDPADATARLLRARALLRLGRGDAAEEDLVLVTLLDPERAEDVKRARLEGVGKR